MTTFLKADSALKSTVKLFKRDQGIRKSTLIRAQRQRGEALRGDLRGDSDGSQPTDTMMNNREARNDFWSIEENYIYRHHVEPRVKLYVPQQESFPTALRSSDVVRRTNTTLDVLQESRIDDCWNIDANRNLSEPWTGVTQFTISNEKPPDGYMWSGARPTKFQATTRPDHLWPDIWSGMSKAAQRKEMQQRAIEKPKLDNDSLLRSIYSIDPEDIEFKETKRRRCDLSSFRAHRNDNQVNWLAFAWVRRRSGSQAATVASLDDPLLEKSDDQQRISWWIG